jgi:transcriptional regulator BetI-like protein
MRDPVMEKVARTFDTSWGQHLSELIQPGMKEQSFRRDIDVDGAVVALMAQIKGIRFHAVTGKLKPSQVKRLVGQAADQAERSLVNPRE